MEKYLAENLIKVRRGFTILELLIYVTIVTVVVVVLTNFILDVTKSASSSKAAKEVQQNTRVLMSKMMREIRRADSINITDCDGLGNCKELQLSIVETPGDPPVTIGFYLDPDGKVYFYTGTRPSPSVPIDAVSTSDIKVTALNFEPVDNSVVIDVTATPATFIAGSGGAYSLSSTFVLRKNVY